MMEEFAMANPTINYVDDAIRQMGVEYRDLKEQMSGLEHQLNEGGVFENEKLSSGDVKLDNNKGIDIDRDLALLETNKSILKSGLLTRGNVDLHTSSSNYSYDKIDSFISESEFNSCILKSEIIEEHSKRKGKLPQVEVISAMKPSKFGGSLQFSSQVDCLHIGRSGTELVESRIRWCTRNASLDISLTSKTCEVINVVSEILTEFETNMHYERKDWFLSTRDMFNIIMLEKNEAVEVSKLRPEVGGKNIINDFYMGNLRYCKKDVVVQIWPSFLRSSESTWTLLIPSTSSGPSVICIPTNVGIDNFHILLHVTQVSISTAKKLLKMIAEMQYVLIEHATDMCETLRDYTAIIQNLRHQVHILDQYRSGLEEASGENDAENHENSNINSSFNI
ncbi:hypothetical protein TorRG33x02_170770 [Trema orientale]|uniref:Uncharacterized protein n=1 Tax=Trema orientale TaxID=63057 RepID=A0A2P5ENH3_TREOI|nr:hypothetical protein TorRG33x02_170770 [Trema orientale]